MDSITFKCPNCDGGLVFDPKGQSFKCEYCLSEFSESQLRALAKKQEKDEAADRPIDLIEPETVRHAEESENKGLENKGTENKESENKGTENKEPENKGSGNKGTENKEPGNKESGNKAPGNAEKEKKLDNAEEAAGLESADGASWPGMAFYTCPSCGAQIMTDETTAASFCYYCHNPVVLSGKLEGGYRPDCVAPFELDRKKAEELFKTWISRKRYAPRDFYSPRQVEMMEGIYYPYWLYSCTVEGQVKARASRQNVMRSGREEITEHNHFQVERKGRLEIKNVARNALQKADRRLAEGVMPFDMEKGKPFTAAYLSGFQAERRDMEKESFEREVEEEVKDFALLELRNSISGYDTVTVESHDERLASPSWKYALLPVWVLTYQDAKKKTYYFAMNGQNGKICGILPVDYRRLACLFGMIFFPVFALLLLGGYLI